MSANEELVFLYTVNPHKVITGLSGVNAIRTAKSLFLTKEDVKICLKRATVYRRFAAEGINERVNIGNIDRLHRENYISEKDWEATLAKEMSEGHGKVEVSNISETSELTKTAEEKISESIVSESVTDQVDHKEDKHTGAIPEETANINEEIIESDDDNEVIAAEESIE